MQSSIQLWSLRLSIDEHGWDRAIDSVAEAGFRNVEPFAIDRTAVLATPGILANALAVPTAHGQLDADAIESTLANAAALGVGTVYHPHFDETHWGSVAAIEATAALLNSAAEKARDYGMLVGFHHHDHELSHDVAGEPVFDCLLGFLTDDVQIEFDVNWAAVARTDAVSAVSGLGGRLNAVHVKDGPLKGGNTDQQALGEGQLHLDEFIEALPADTLLVLSLDQFQGSSEDVADAIATSRAWFDDRGIS